MKIGTHVRSAVLATVLLSLVLFASGCAAKTAEKPGTGSQDQTATGDAPQDSEGVTLYTPQYAPNGQETAVMTTSKGIITIELFGTDAPIHVGNFVELARKGFYDDTKFHRYEPGFVVQGGDPQSKGMTPEEVVRSVADTNSPVRLGTGGPGYVIKGEFDRSVNPNTHLVGSLGMARSQNPDSAGSQFYFCLSELTPLDGSYTVFGRITEGLDVMKQLRIGDVIEKVEIKGATE